MKLMMRMIPQIPAFARTSFGQVKGFTFPDQVRDRLQYSGSAGPTSSAIVSNSYPLPEWRGTFRPRFLSAFPVRSCETRDYKTHRTVLPPGAGPGAPGHRRPFSRFHLSPGKPPLTVLVNTVPPLAGFLGEGCPDNIPGQVSHGGFIPGKYALTAEDLESRM